MTVKELIRELQKILKTQKACDDYPVLIHDWGLGYDLLPLASVTAVPELGEDNVVILMTEEACKTMNELAVFQEVHGPGHPTPRLEELERWVNSPAGKAALAEHHDSEGKFQIEKR